MAANVVVEAGAGRANPAPGGVGVGAAAAAATTRPAATFTNPMAGFMAPPTMGVPPHMSAAAAAFQAQAQAQAMQMQQQLNSMFFHHQGGHPFAHPMFLMPTAAGAFAAHAHTHAHGGGSGSPHSTPATSPASSTRTLSELGPVVPKMAAPATTNPFLPPSALTFLVPTPTPAPTQASVAAPTARTTTTTSDAKDGGNKDRPRKRRIADLTVEEAEKKPLSSAPRRRPGTKTTQQPAPASVVATENAAEADAAASPTDDASDDADADADSPTPTHASKKKRDAVVKTSVFRGVSACGRDRKFQARIRLGNNVLYLGRFKTELEAALRYDDAVRHYGSQKLSYPTTNFRLLDEAQRAALLDHYAAHGTIKPEFYAFFQPDTLRKFLTP